MAIRQDIGIVTAYGYAVSKGYEGTEEEFAQAMADVGINVSEIEASIKEFNEETVPAAMQSIIDEGNARVANVSAEGTRQMNAVTQRGANEILAVENAGTTQIRLVNEAGASQVEAVNSAGTTQVGNVNTAGGTQVAAVQAKGQEVIDSIPSDYSALTQEVSDLNQAISELYDATTVVDMYRENTSVVRTDNVLTSAIWDGDTKTVTVTMSASASSSDSYYVVLSPKFIANHRYKVAIKYLYPIDYAYTYVRNVFSTSNFNSRDDMVNGAAKYNNAEEVLTLNATSDGWLALGIRVAANNQFTWSWKLAVYDVTDIDISGVSDSGFLFFDDEITLGTSGLIPQIQSKAEYAYQLVSNVKGETWTALGDSLTAQGSGSLYLGYVKDRLGLDKYNNCGIGGTTISGATNSNAMYQDVRINALDIDSKCVTVMGGTNDFWQEYYKNHPNANLTGWGDCTRDNYDVSTFCGAYNVLISKILYKFCLIPAYYPNIDYSGIAQASAIIDNFRLILITPPQAFHVEGDSASASLLLNGITSAHSYVKQIAELWSLPCVDSWEMGMNDINKPLFFANYLTDATHFNAFGHERLASLIIDKALQISRYK